MSRMLRVTSTVLVAVSATPFPMHEVSAQPQLTQQKADSISNPRPRAGLRNYRNTEDLKLTTSRTIYALSNRRIVKISENSTSVLQTRIVPKPPPKTNKGQAKTGQAKETVKTQRRAPTSDATVSRETSLSSAVKSASGRGVAIAKYALGLVGRPYRWGGDTPSGFDCSGLILYVYNHVGIHLPRTSYAQFTVGSTVSWKDLEPGDLVFFSTDAKGASHVAIYVGNGLIVQALNSRTGVIVSHLDGAYYTQRFIGAKRPY